MQLEVTSNSGKATRDLTIVAGDRPLALTPPLGWNSWNVWARAVDAEEIRHAADWMVKTGLAAHGYQYINIDDAWMGERNASGAIQPNDRFGDMKALANYVHARGLKIGLYSSPGPTTCQNLPGSFEHEKQDAQAYAIWGYDYLKYDLCSYRGKLNDPKSRKDNEKPYRIMGDALRALCRATSCSVSASTGRRAFPNGGRSRKSADSSGAPLATSATPGRACRRKASARAHSQMSAYAHHAVEHALIAAAVGLRPFEARSTPDRHAEQR